MDDDDEDEGDVNDPTLDSSQISRLESSEQDNIVALSDGTQVAAKASLMPFYFANDKIIYLSALKIFKRSQPPEHTNQ